MKLNPKPLLRNLPPFIGALIFMYFTAYFHGEHMDRQNAKLCKQSTLMECER